MSTEASHRTLDEFATDDGVDLDAAEKTYTLRNVREFLGDRVGTAPRNWVASMVEKFPEAVAAYKVDEQAMDDDLRTMARRREIEEAADEHDAPGMPVDAAEIAAELREHDFYDCRVTVGEFTDAGRQVVRVRGALRNYEIHVDAEVVHWTA